MRLRIRHALKIDAIRSAFTFRIHIRQVYISIAYTKSFSLDIISLSNGLPAY